MTRVALEYKDYLVERIVAVGDAQINQLNLGDQTEHFWSSGCCDPIVSAGSGPRFRIIETEIPAWLISGIERGQQDGRWHREDPLHRAAKIALYGCFDGWAKGLRPLVNKRGKFADSLRSFFTERGYLTERQVTYV